MTSRELDRAVMMAGEFAHSRDFAGADPYDGLSSPLASIVPGRLPRQALIQSVKRSNLTVRKLLGIRPLRMAKATALFAEGYALLGQHEEARRLGDRLVASQSGGPWGYEFDVQTRWAYYKANTPNVIATAFAVRALAHLNRLNEVNPQTLEWLYSLTDARGFFHYTPASGALIHNGNLLAAETVARLGGDLVLVKAAVDLTLGQQNHDGSWQYGEGKQLSWIDNFHTVYVLESLSDLLDYGIGSREQLALGVAYWRNSLFTEDKLPLHFAGDSGPSSDVHNIATVVGGLAKLDRDCELPLSGLPSVKLLLSHQGRDGGFRNRARSVPFMRWNQAHAFRALAKIVASEEGPNGIKD